MIPTSGVNPFSVGKSTFQPSTPFQGASQGANFWDTSKGPSFKDTLVNMVSDANRSIMQPDKLMNEALTTGDVDIHDVMIANAKAEMTVNIASQVITKVIQAYEKVQQIQV